MVGGRLFLTNLVGLLRAVDPASGETLWSQAPFEPTIEEARGLSPRGVDLWTGGERQRLFLARGNYLYSVDASSGELLQLPATSEFWRNFGLTLYRTLFSFGLACLVGTPIGLAMGYWKAVSAGLDLIVDFFRSVPPLALFPLFILAFGLGDASKLAVAFYGCVLVVIVNSAYGVANAPKIRRQVGESLGFSKAQLFGKVVLPDAAPQIFAGYRTALSLALVLSIVVELFLGSDNGMGKLLCDYHLLFEVEKMYVVILATGVLGYTRNRVFVFFERRIVHWADT